MSFSAIKEMDEAAACYEMKCKWILLEYKEVIKIYPIASI